MTAISLPPTSRNPGATPIPIVEPAYGDVLSAGQSLYLQNNVLAWGGVIICPSDCGFTLSALPTARAVEMIDAIRGDHTTALPLSVAGLAGLEGFVDFHPVHVRIAASTWPGGVTIVAKAIEREGLAWSSAVRGNRHLGVRQSRHITEFSLVSSCGTPLISAALRSPAGELVTTFDDAYALVLDRLVTCRIPGRPIAAIRPREHRFSFDRASTVVRLDAGEPVILREGDHDKRAFASMLRTVVPGEWGEST